MRCCSSATSMGGSEKHSPWTSGSRTRSTKGKSTAFSRLAVHLERSTSFESIPHWRTRLQTHSARLERQRPDDRGTSQIPKKSMVDINPVIAWPNASNVRQLGGMFNGDVPQGQDEGGLSYAGSSRVMVNMTNEIAAAPTEAKRNALKAQHAGFMNNHIRQFGPVWIGMPPVPPVPAGRHNPNRDPRKQSGTGSKKRMVKAKKQKGGKCACHMAT